MNISSNRFKTQNNNYYRNKTVYVVNKPWQALIITVVAILAGIGILIYGINSNIKTKDYIETTAVVVDYDRDFDDTYSPIVEYNVSGKTYRSTSTSSSNNPDPIGTYITIKYNPNDPSEVSWNTGLSVVLVPAIGILFIVVGGIGSIKFIRKGLSEGFTSGSNEKYTYNNFGFSNDNQVGNFNTMNYNQENNFNNQTEDFNNMNYNQNNSFNNQTQNFNNIDYNQNNNFNNQTQSFNNIDYNQNNNFNNQAGDFNQDKTNENNNNNFNNNF